MTKYNTKWARKETLAAFNLYCQMPLGRVHSRNKIIIALAQKMGRTPGSLSMKMGNLAFSDPKTHKGLPHASQLDKEIWAEFFANPDKLIYESEQAFAAFNEQSVETRTEVSPDIVATPHGEECERLVRVRVNQAFFRRTVLAAYNERCCITGLDAPELLNASYIIPWEENRGRVNPGNGLCLNALHDRAFDQGLLTVHPDGTILISARLRDAAKTCNESAFVVGCDNGKINMPDKFKPEADFLDYHNQHIFVGI